MARRRKHASTGSIEQLLAAKEIVIHCGSGGVGKTTTAAAAAAMAAVHHGGKVLVLTVDPARRLANALGLETFGNVETQVPREAFLEAGVEPRGELWAAMLDTKQSWDDLVCRHAPDPATRDAILANPLYKNITGRFVQSHDYIAMERLYEIHASGTYDLIVVDTPPTRNAIDFLEAPERMADFFSSRLLRWLTVPARSRVLNLASKPFYSVADRILGSKFLEDIAEFFLLFQTMYDGFVDRAKAVTRTLEDQRTTFVVVSTLESAPVREAEFFVEALDDRGLHLGAVVLNKVLPSWFLDKGASAAAKELCARSDELAPVLPTVAGAPEQVARVLHEVGESFLNFQVVAKREAEIRAELSAAPEVIAAVPYFDHDITDLAGLLDLGQQIWAVTPPSPVAVASGHPATTAAAIEVLEAGGNAVDACVAAGFAASVAEPTLTSLAGGGFLLARTSAGEEVLFDFFVDTPGRGRRATDAPLDFEEVVVRFSGAEQGFHVGLGSVAVPGCLAGLLHAHRRLGRVELSDVTAPARRLAADGVEVNDQQAYLLRILEPILTRTPDAAAVVAPGGRLLDRGDRLTNPALAAFLGAIDDRGFAEPTLAAAVERAMDAGRGLLTADDLAGYRVVEREPLAVRWRGHRLLTNPPPAFGGELVALGLLELEGRQEWPAAVESDEHAIALAESMIATDTIRTAGRVGEELRRRSTGGTTHVSVADAEGGAASMTTSNGEGSGWMLPGTGVMANNMMGEDDLHPGGFHTTVPGERVASMMAPSLVVDADGVVRLVVGSGGSKRIRTALAQVIAGVVDQGRTVAEAVEAPRLHWDGERLHAEPGWSDEVLGILQDRWPLTRWIQRDLYFGGVQAVVPAQAAAADPRRGGDAQVRVLGS